MSINSIRFRAEDGKVILQVRTERRRSIHSYSYGDDRDEGDWRDATVEDLLQVAQFTRAHDYLDSQLGRLQAEVQQLRDMTERDTRSMF